MGKSILWRTRFRRRLIYISGAYLAVFSAIVIPAVGIWHAARSQFNQAFPGQAICWLVTGLLLALVLIVLRNYLEYRRVIYDPHWAMNFQDRFDKMNGQERARAAKVLRDQKADLASIHNPVLAEIDNVLDFFEDVGVYQRADHISPELAHHHFFHWIRIYWQAAKPYIQAWRQKEPARWNHVEELFDTACDIELKENGGTRQELLLDDADLDEFLRLELDDAGNKP